MGKKHGADESHIPDFGPTSLGAGGNPLGGMASAWARETDEGRGAKAPGGPGDEPHWFSAAKDGVGTSIASECHGASLVWFTLSRGILSEVYYPRVDHACIRCLGLVVTDGKDFFSDEKEDADHHVEYPVEGVPLYRLTSICSQGRYKIEKSVLAHPSQNVVLQSVTFTPLKGDLADYRLYVIVEPHLGNQGTGNTAWLGANRGAPMLFAERAGHALALACSTPWVNGLVGFVGASDGWQDLKRHKRLTWEYSRADDGNVSATGEVDLRACDGRFRLALGFGENPAEAGHRALASLYDDAAELEREYIRGWSDWQARLHDIPRVDGGGRDLYRHSTLVMRTHEAGSIPGAVLASLSTPWGESRGDKEKQGTGGYHLVWPRDLVETAGALLAAGASAEALQVLAYLRATQASDGHWTQNQWVDSSVYWEGIQLGETAFPALLLGLMRRERILEPAAVAGYWPMVRRAMSYIVRRGPSTQQDRWENQNGYTPFTLAVVITALVIAAELADEHAEPEVGTYLRETADAWNSAIESWLYVKDTDLAHEIGVEGYYARIIPPDLDEVSTPKMGRLELSSKPSKLNGIPVTEIVSPDALAFVRFGLRAHDDARILNTLKVIDAKLKVETPRGPSWHRYNGDQYGEAADGSPFNFSSDGIGRVWPLLTGERAHYELMAGRRSEAVKLLHAMSEFACQGGMIPEQVWNAEDIPERRLLKGRPSGSAMPLVWAHAEYVKLRCSLSRGEVFDLPSQTVQRYLTQKVSSSLVIWRFDHQRAVISPGEILRVEVLAPAVVYWSADGGRPSREIATRDTGLGIHVADLPTASLREDDEIRLTFRWPEAGDRWEREEFTVKVIAGS